MRNPVARLRVVDEQARQVEQARDPGHHEDEVQRFDEQHALCLFPVVAARWRAGCAAGDGRNGRRPAPPPPAGPAAAPRRARRRAARCVSSSPWIRIVSAGTGIASRCFTATPTSTMRSGLTRCASLVCTAAPNENPASTGLSLFACSTHGREIVHLAAALRRARPRSRRRRGNSAARPCSRARRTRAPASAPPCCPACRRTADAGARPARRPARRGLRARRPRIRSFPPDPRPTRAACRRASRAHQMRSRSTMRPCRRCCSMISSMSARST